MRKITVLALLLAIFFIGCSTAPRSVSGPLYEQFQGTWQREDGATFRFFGNEYEFVSFPNAMAGFGKYEFRRDGRVDIIFSHFIYLRESTVVPVRNGMTGEITRDFQIAAWEEYRSLYMTPEEIEEMLIERPDSFNNGSGNNWRVFSIEGNTLVIDDNNDPSWVRTSIAGTYTRQ